MAMAFAPVRRPVAPGRPDHPEFGCNVQAEPAPVELEMGYSIDEFAGVLAPAMRDWAVAGGPHTWSVCSGDGQPLATIDVAPGADRRVGALRLPVLHVRIRFETTSAVHAAELLRRFERGFHRGGG